MIVTEETARRIADELKRLNDLLDRWPALPSPAFLLQPGQCMNCGGYHNGLPCRHLSPTAIT